MALPMPPDPALLLELEDLPPLRESWTAMGRRVVLTNGCFDLFHPGHVRCLQAARGLGDVLVVAVNDDQSVRALKGPGRPIMTLSERQVILAAMRFVDAVVAFGGPTAEGVVATLRPDVYVKGGDYDPDTNRPPEADVAAALGASVVFIPRVGDESTSEVLRRLKKIT